MKKIDYKFQDINLLTQALTHPSVNNTNPKFKNSGTHYERLEFLGDAVLALVITEYLVNNYLLESEGELAKRRAALVSGATISTIADTINLGDFIIMTEGEVTLGGRTNLNNLENVLEALIGAVYLDGGLCEVKKIIHKLWHPVIDQMVKPPQDPKTELQEWAQKLGKPIPLYIVTKTTGPAHMPVFTVSLEVSGIPSVIATASSKKTAEREAAKLMLTKIKENE